MSSPHSRIICWARGSTSPWQRKLVIWNHPNSPQSTRKYFITCTVRFFQEKSKLLYNACKLKNFCIIFYAIYGYWIKSLLGPDRRNYFGKFSHNLLASSRQCRIYIHYDLPSARSSAFHAGIDACKTQTHKFDKGVILVYLTHDYIYLSKGYIPRTRLICYLSTPRRAAPRVDKNISTEVRGI